MVLKLTPILNLKIMLKGIKTIKIMKWSKNKWGLTQVKAIFLHINTRNFDMLCQQGNPRYKNIVSGCVVRSAHHIDILNAKLIEYLKKRIFKRLHN